jgi:RNA polymerase sigma factor (sigma-70 family)
LFEQWYPRLVRAARRRLGSPDDAEDVAQDAFVQLIDARRAESRRAAVPRDSRAWLFTVTDRLAIDRHRATVRRERVAALPSVHVVPEVPSADDEIEREECIARVQRVLQALDARDRQLLLLHHAGLAYREIAAQLGVAPSSIGSLLTRAHRRFLVHYQQQYGTSPEACANAHL